MAKEFVVYPRLKKSMAEKIASQLNSQPIREIATPYTGTQHVKVDYSPTGNRVRTDELIELQMKIRDCATVYGYPDVQNISNATYGDFDAKCSELLHQTMNIYPAEAAHIEVWSFLTCVLLPDVVRWRFYDKTTASERFIGSNRGLRRNTFGRLWWRAFLLHQPNCPEPYKYIYRLGEDELVQITERSVIARNPVLICATAQGFLSVIEKHPEVLRRDLMREATKRIRRLVSLLSFETLDESEVGQIILTTFEQTWQALQTSTEIVTA